MDMQLVEVSLQLAAQWLTRNTDNRPLSKGTVKAGITVQLTVAHGVPRTAFTVMDTGRKRTGRDRTAPNSAWSGGSSVTSNDQLLDVLGKHPGIRDALQHGIALNRGCRITVTAAMIGWYVTTEPRPDIDHSAWEEGVVTGARLEPGDARLTLRNTMLNPMPRISSRSVLTSADNNA
ncbi:hypothetical protein AB0I54_06905 [Streptomyces sp. NPDC050625]|uniref:hypothetical protein n=1 Tax=Streptomyces sp. NPDC050625 TaxID=3154629 RepID=UPI00343FC3EA